MTLLRVAHLLGREEALSKRLWCFQFLITPKYSHDKCRTASR